MATQCGRCGEIHFETHQQPIPDRCRACGFAMAESVEGEEQPVSLEPVRDATCAVAATSSRLMAVAWWCIAVGVLILAGGGAFAWYSQVTSDTWQVTTARVTQDSVVSGAGMGIGAIGGVQRGPSARKVLVRASYQVGSSIYYLDAGDRPVGSTFEVYYDPTKPARASESRPSGANPIVCVIVLLGVMCVIVGVARLVAARQARSKVLEPTT